MSERKQLILSNLRMDLNMLKSSARNVKPALLDVKRELSDGLSDEVEADRLDVLLLPLEEAKGARLRVDHQGEHPRQIEEIIVDEAVHPRKEQPVARVRVVPA